MKRQTLSRNNIWQKEDFRMCTIGKKFKLVALVVLKEGEIT